MRRDENVLRRTQNRVAFFNESLFESSILLQRPITGLQAQQHGALGNFSQWRL